LKIYIFPVTLPWWLLRRVANIRLKRARRAYLLVYLKTTVDFFNYSGHIMDSTSDLHHYHRVYCGHCGHFFDVPVYCGNRFCPICSVQRRKRIRHKISWTLSHTISRKFYNWRHLTLSEPSGFDLRSQLDHLISSFRRLRNRKLWKNHVFGGCYVIEITRTDSGWHPHLHIVIFARYIPYFKLLQSWKRSSSGSACFIKTIPKKAIISYLTKYISKIDLKDEDVHEASESLSGKRLVCWFGQLTSIAIKCPKIRSVCPNCGEVCWHLLSNYKDSYTDFRRYQEHSIVSSRSP
jgi:hypothetical protein